MECQTEVHRETLFSEKREQESVWAPDVVHKDAS